MQVQLKLNFRLHFNRINKIKFIKKTTQNQVNILCLQCPMLYYTFSYLCVLRLDDVENPLLQTWHMCGFSPVWVRMWRFNKLGRSKDLPQTQQGNMVLRRRGVKILVNKMKRILSQVTIKTSPQFDLNNIHYFSGISVLWSVALVFFSLHFNFDVNWACVVWDSGFDNMLDKWSGLSKRLWLE